MSSSSGNVRSNGMEFRSLIDDAWYNVQVKLDGDVLRVNYCDFPSEMDEVFDVKNFRSFDEVEVFKARFRPLSLQLQDSECSKDVNGMAVCASYSFQPDDVRFYDAVLEGHGPNAGNLSAANIANICQVQSGAINDGPVATFLGKAGERIKKSSCNYVLTSEGDSPQNNVGSCHTNERKSSIKQKLTFFQRMQQEKRGARRSMNSISPYEGKIGGDHEATQDKDLGGIKNEYLLLLENLDKGLSPLRIAEFLHGQTSISARVCVFPSSCYDLYARGAIVLDCKKNLEKLYDFLDNPDHIIVSSKGRPFVVTGRLTRPNTLDETTGALMHNSDHLQKKLRIQNGSAGVCNELKVVNSGSKEYKIAKQMKELFMEFISHQWKLQQRLILEENNMMWCK